MSRYRQPSLPQSRLQSPSLRSTTAWLTHLEEALTSNSDEVNDKCVAIDCEMVGVGHMGHESALARVSIVNYYGVTLLDEYVKPRRKIVDYRTPYSGITSEHLENACDFEQVQREVQEILEEKLVIGQSLGFDFKALELECPTAAIRDTSHYYYLFGDSFGRRLQYKNKKPSLKKLANEVLGLDIQARAHDSVEDARICMILYRLKQNEWETALSADNNKSLMSLDIGKCSICSSLSHVNSRCPKNPFRQNIYY